MIDVRNKYKVEVREKLKVLEEKKRIIEQQIIEYNDFLDTIGVNSDEENTEDGETN